MEKKTLVSGDFPLPISGQARHVVPAKGSGWDLAHPVGFKPDLYLGGWLLALDSGFR